MWPPDPGRPASAGRFFCARSARLLPADAGSIDRPRRIRPGRAQYLEFHEQAGELLLELDEVAGGGHVADVRLRSGCIDGVMGRQVAALNIGKPGVDSGPIRAPHIADILPTFKAATG